MKGVAAAEEVEVYRVCGYMLSLCTRSKYVELGKSIWDDKGNQSIHIPIPTAMTLYSDCDLGRQSYTKQRKLLTLTGNDILPPWYKIREEQQKLSPPVLNLPSPHVGVYYQFLPAVKITIQQILKTKPTSFSSITMHMKFGFDGSGSHAIYNQSNNEETNNIIITMFCPLSITSGKIKVWEQPAPNNPQSQRPLMIQMGKESVEKLQSLEILNKEIEEMKNGFSVETDKGLINAKAIIVAYMMDLKATHLFLGVGGAYCDLCFYSKEECFSKEIVNQGFFITRDVQSMHNIFNDLVQEDGSILKKTQDYHVRFGQTTKPIAIASCDVNTYQILHALLRLFDIFMNTTVHCKARVFTWSVPDSSRMKEFIKTARLQLQEHIKNCLNIKWDFPDSTGKGGTSTKGNIARELLFNKVNRDIIVK